MLAFQVCKEEEEAIKVDVHEECGRVKLFWILTLSDARNLKLLVEFPSLPSTSLPLRTEVEIITAP